MKKNSFMDIAGQRFGRLVAIAHAGHTREGMKGRTSFWKCRCDCGNEKIIRAAFLRNGLTRSCGCLLAAASVKGRRFGRLLVIGQQGTVCRCKCDCGASHSVKSHCLTNGDTRSCGCLQRELFGARFRTHGDTKSTEHRSWNSAKNRCFNSKNAEFRNYGKRGITMCSKWVKSYSAFLKDMGRKPTPKHSLERIDVNGNYEPSNCCWATQKQQCNNKRNNRLLTFMGRTQNIQRWSEELGISKSVIWARLDDLDWTVEKTLSTPTLAIGRPAKRMITFNGRTMTETQWSAERGWPRPTVTSRLLQGWSNERALTQQPRTRKNKTWPK